MRLSEKAAVQAQYNISLYTRIMPERSLEFYVGIPFSVDKFLQGPCLGFLLYCYSTGLRQVYAYSVLGPLG